MTTAEWTASKLRLRDAYEVRRMKSPDGKEFIRRHHYSRGSHNGPTCYGLYSKASDELVGVCAFAAPCSENVRASVFGTDSKSSVTELHRLVLLDEVPHNGESFFIGRALTLLKADKPGICAVLSFADATEGHIGTIYQATNALYCGTSGRATFYRDGDGRLRHPRQNGVNVGALAARALGWEPVKRDGKHRYLFLLPNSKHHRKELIGRLRLTSLPYPKRGVTTPLKHHSITCEDPCGGVRDCMRAEAGGMRSEPNPKRVIHKSLWTSVDISGKRSSRDPCEAILSTKSPSLTTARERLKESPLSTASDNGCMDQEYLEACPECGTRNVSPFTTKHPDERTVIGFYCCPCGSRWETSWWNGEA